MERGIGGPGRAGDRERLRLVRALFPDTAQALDRALDAHGGTDAVAAFDEWIDARASELIPGAGFADVDDVEAATRLQRAFSAARRASAWFASGTVASGPATALHVPEPEAFSEAGVDFVALARALAADPALVPVPAPYGLGADAWRAAYRAAALDGARRSSRGTGAGASTGDTVEGATSDAGNGGNTGESSVVAPAAFGFPEGPLASPEDSNDSPLVFASEAVRGFDQLDAIPVPGGRALPVVAATSGAGARTESGAAPGGSARTSATGPGAGASYAGAATAGAGAGATMAGDRRRLRWTLRLVPAGEKPQTLGLGFAHGEHVSLPEMLMLQLMNIADGREPIDSASFTWLAGPLAEGRMAARHVYDAGERVVRITCREVGSQGPHMGARPPIG